MPIPTSNSGTGSAKEGSTVSEPSCILVPCCDICLPETLYAEVLDVVWDGASDCHCPVGLVIPLHYQNGVWAGEGEWHEPGDCPPEFGPGFPRAPLKLELSCASSGNEWWLFYDECGHTGFGASDKSDVRSCEPLYLEFQVTDNGCNSSLCKHNIAVTE